MKTGDRLKTGGPRRGLGWVAMTALAFAMAMTMPSAMATITDLGPEGAWVNACDIDRMTDVKVCRLVNYRMVEDGKEGSFIALTVAPVGSETHLFLTTSLGNIENCALRIDRQPPQETRIATVNMCVFPNITASKLLEQMRNGATMLVRLTLSRTGRRDLDFSLNGFTRNLEEMQRNLR